MLDLDSNDFDAVQLRMMTEEKLAAQYTVRNNTTKFQNLLIVNISCFC